MRTSWHGDCLVSMLALGKHVSMGDVTYQNRTDGKCRKSRNELEMSCSTKSMKSTRCRHSLRKKECRKKESMKKKMKRKKRTGGRERCRKT